MSKFVTRLRRWWRGNVKSVAEVRAETADDGLMVGSIILPIAGAQETAVYAYQTPDNGTGIASPPPITKTQSTKPKRIRKPKAAPAKPVTKPTKPVAKKPRR